MNHEMQDRTACLATHRDLLADATVLQVQGTRMQLAVARQSACSHCSERGSCSSHSEVTSRMVFWMNTPQQKPVAGQYLQLAVPQRQVWSAAMLVYGLPLLGFLLGLVLAPERDDLAALSAGLGLLAGGILAWLLGRHYVAPMHVVSTQKQMNGGENDD